MNIPTPVPITELKEGELYFREVTIKSASKYYYNIIVKIKKNKLEPDLKKLITYTYSSLKNYNIFSKITDFNKRYYYSSDDYDFFETYIKVKHHHIEYSFYKFNEEWFLRNKKKILLYMNCYNQTEKSFPKIFKEIESEKK